MDPGDGHAAGSQLDHEEDEVPPEPRQRQHLDGEQIAGRQALPVRLQERLPGHVPAPLGRRVDSVVVQDPLHRGPGDSVAEVRERAADPRVAPPRIVDRHPDHELGDVLSGHWSTSTSAGAAIVFRGDQSPVPTQDRIRGDDARDLRQDLSAEFVTAHSESTTLGVRQAKRPRAQVFSEDPILLPEIVDQIVLVTVHPASEREDEELQRRRHSLRLLGRLDQHRPSLGRFFGGEGEWAAAKHGGRGRRGWKTRHLGVDRSGVIVARALTEASVDDATTGITLIEAVDGALGRVTADAAYDTVGFYEAAGARRATVVVPPTSTANVSRHGPRSSARDRTILAVKERGRRRWKQTSGYHGQARVENAFFRYTSIVGDSLRACSPAGRGTEVVLACNILNQITGLGRPMSYRIDR